MEIVLDGGDVGERGLVGECWRTWRSEQSTTTWEKEQSSWEEEQWEEEER